MSETDLTPQHFGEIVVVDRDPVARPLANVPPLGVQARAAVLQQWAFLDDQLSHDTADRAAAANDSINPSPLSVVTM